MYIKKGWLKMLYRVRVALTQNVYSQFTDNWKIVSMWATDSFLNNPSINVYIQSKELSDELFQDEYLVVRGKRGNIEFEKV